MKKAQLGLYEKTDKFIIIKHNKTDVIWFLTLFKRNKFDGGALILHATHLYVRVLCVNVSIGKVGKVLEVQDEGLSLLLRLWLWKKPSGAVLRM